jgi:hypothetical protein
VKLKYIYLLTGITAFLIWYILIRNGIYSISADETSRSLISYYWYSTGKLESSSWLPLHFIFTGAGFLLFNNLIWLPRMVSLLFGIMTIVSVGILTDKLFSKSEITIYAMIIALLIPQRLILSIVPLPEIIFFFFIIAASILLLNFLRYNKAGSLIYAAIFLSAASALRYEGWIIAASAGVFVIFRIKGIKNILPVIIILASFPLFWLSYNYFSYNDFFYFMNEPENYYSLVMEDTFFNRIKYNPLMQFTEQILITLNFIGLTAVYLLRKNKIIMTWLFIMFIPLILFSITSLKVDALPAHNFWRTSAVWVLLLIPFTAWVVYQLRKMPGRISSGFILIMLTVFLLYSNYFYIDRTHQEYVFNSSRIKTAESLMDFMNGNGHEKERILIEDVRSFEHFDITLASQKPFIFIYSERNKLTPIKPEKYIGVDINYYFVRSKQLKSRMDRENFRKVFKQNGWELYLKKDASAENIKH